MATVAASPWLVPARAAAGATVDKAPPPLRSPKRAALSVTGSSSTNIWGAPLVYVLALEALAVASSVGGLPVESPCSRDLGADRILQLDRLLLR